MKLSRRSVLRGGMAAAALAAAAPALAGNTRRGRPLRKPDSRIAGVQIGVITYSFREMAKLDAESLLGYCREVGINAVELMGDPAEWFAGIPVKLDQPSLWRARARMAPGQPPLSADEQKQVDAVLATYKEYQAKSAGWRAHAAMKPFEQLRRMYNAAGVSIYAFKPDVFDRTNTDAEVDYGMRAAHALGASHVTVELPDDVAQIKRLGAAAARHGLKVGYHEHDQARPTLWDAALAASASSGINLDLGHYVAAGDYDGLAFVREHHPHILSMHLKDRTNKAHGQGNLAWGKGDTPIAEVLRLMRDRRYGFPATIELEYDIPAGSDAVKEVAKCLEFCRQALNA